MAKVLLIEPDMLLADNMRNYLESLGHNVQWRADAQSAIDSADTSKPDVVVLELQLAMHSGMEFLYEFRSYPEWQSIPVVILSNIASSEIGTSSIFWKQLEVVAYHYKAETKLSRLAATIDKALEITDKYSSPKNL